MFCAQCGKSNDDQGKFCQSCGAPLEPQKTDLAPSPPPKSGQFNTDNKFFNFMDPFLAFIDSGELFRKPFRWLYLFIAAINVLLPFYLLFVALKNNVFQLPGKFIFAFGALWIVIAFAGWISFQIWWNRSSKVANVASPGEDFVATPVFSHFIQTFGEWAGVWVGIVGFISAIIAVALLGDEARMMSQMPGMGFLGAGVSAIFLMPLYGFLIIVFSRFVAEQCRAIAAIANNTKKCADQGNKD
jgi:hypothetical protein